jgi:hypothetical protein
MLSHSFAWLFWALGSAAFAALTAIFAKIGVANVNSDLATFIRTAVVLSVLAGIVILAIDELPAVIDLGPALPSSRIPSVSRSIVDPVVGSSRMQPLTAPASLPQVARAERIEFVDVYVAAGLHVQSSCGLKMR